MTSLLERLAKWRSLTDTQKLAYRKAVIPTRVANSMAMEGEPVSMDWLWDNDQDEFYKRLRVESVAKANRTR